jgi:hypothetical protein
VQRASSAAPHSDLNARRHRAERWKRLQKLAHTRPRTCGVRRGKSRLSPRRKAAPDDGVSGAICLPSACLLRVDAMGGVDAGGRYVGLVSAPPVADSAVVVTDLLLKAPSAAMMSFMSSPGWPTPGRSSSRRSRAP